MNAFDGPGPSKRNLRVLAAAGALLWLALAFSSARYKTVVIDECPHIAAGLTAIEHFDFRINPEHPPLIKVLSVLPVYLFARPDLTMINDEEGTAVSHWLKVRQNELGFYLIFRRSANPQRLIAIARIVPILIGLLGGWLAFLWGRELTRRFEGGLVSASLLVFYPEYIGHARFVTLDVPTLVACGGISWCAFLWWKRPDLKRLSLLAAVCAAGSQVKLPVSAFAAFTCFTLFGLSFFSGRRVRPRQALLLIAVVALSGYLAAWAGAGFRFSAIPEGADIWGSINHLSTITEPDSKPLLRFAHEHRLLPETTLATLNHLGSFRGRRVYLMGNYALEGWYSYFFVTALVKTPLLVLAGWGGLLWTLCRFLGRRKASLTFSWRLQRGLILFVPFAVLFAMLVHSRINIGHRHMLFLYFPLSVLLGALVTRWLFDPAPPLALARARRAAAALLLASHAGAIVFSYPHYATYVNVFFRDPYTARQFVLDSNVDWGQDIPLLAAALEQLPYDGVNLALFTSSNWETYGIEEFNWILPSYPFAMAAPQEASPPDLTLPTAVSLNCLYSVRNMYPGPFDREPDLKLNSIAVFLP